MGPTTLLCKSCAYFRSFANQTKSFNKKLFGQFKKLKTSTASTKNWPKYVKNAVQFSVNFKHL